MISYERNNFFPLKKKYLTKELNLLVKEDIIFTNCKNDFYIEYISSLNILRENSILFLDDLAKLYFSNTL